MVALEAPRAVFAFIQPLDYYPVVRTKHIYVSGSALVAGTVYEDGATIRECRLHRFTSHVYDNASRWIEPAAIQPGTAERYMPYDSFVQVSCAAAGGSSQFYHLDLAGRACWLGHSMLNSLGGFPDHFCRTP